MVREARMGTLLALTRQRTSDGWACCRDGLSRRACQAPRRPTAMIRQLGARRPGSEERAGTGRRGRRGGRAGRWSARRPGSRRSPSHRQYAATRTAASLRPGHPRCPRDTLPCRHDVPTCADTAPPGRRTGEVRPETVGRFPGPLSIRDCPAKFHRKRTFALASADRRLTVARAAQRAPSTAGDRRCSCTQARGDEPAPAPRRPTVVASSNWRGAYRRLTGRDGRPHDN